MSYHIRSFRFLTCRRTVRKRIILLMIRVNCSFCQYAGWKADYEGIANIFSQMGLVEAWGSGIKRILNAAEEYGLPKPRL